MSNKKVIGEYYADYDEDSKMWCVFHTDKKAGYAYSSWASRYNAEQDARERNEDEQKKESETLVARREIRVAKLQRRRGLSKRTHWDFDDNE